MALNSLGLGFVFTASDLASGKIQKLSHQMMMLSAASQHAGHAGHDGMAQLTAGFGVLAAGAVSLGVAFGLASAFGDFEQGIARVGAISRATVAQLGVLKQAAIEAGIATSFSPMEAVEGLENLASQGFDATDSAKLLLPALTLAEGGMIAVASATSATTSAMKVFGLSMDEAVGGVDAAGKKLPSLSDKLLAIANSTSLAAKDLELALGTVGRGAIVTGQNLDEMLISMGLVKNTGLDASVAAQSVSSALVFVAKQASSFKKLGVDVTDATGKFRPFLDIVQDTALVLGERYTDQAELAAEATKLFSRFGLSAFSAISKQLTTGVKDLNGRLYQGAAAVAFLRKEMADSAGTAQKFQDQVLNTFAGQKKLLVGSLQTLAVVAGEGFAMVFRPVVVAIKDAANNLITFIQGLSPEAKLLFSRLVVGFALVVTAVGAFMTAFVGIKILLPFITAGFSLLVTLLTTLGPVLLALFALHRVFTYVVENNLGGLGEKWANFVGSVKLALSGLGQLFTEGGFSGAVMREMRKAENSGVRHFVVGFFMVVHRAMQFFRGVWLGLSSALDAAAPTFAKLGEALTRIGIAFGLVGEKGAVAMDSSQGFAEFGAKLGVALGFIIDVLAKVWTAYATYIGGIVEGFKAVFGKLGPIFSGLGDSFRFLADQVFGLLESLGVGVSKGTSFTDVFLFLGRVVGGVVAGAVGVLGAVLSWVVGLVGGVVWVVRQLGDVFMAVAETIKRVVLAIGGWIAAMVDKSIANIGKLVGFIPSAIRPEGADVVVEAGKRAEARIAASGGERGVLGAYPAAFRALTTPETAEAAGSIAAEQSRRDVAAAEASARAEEMMFRQQEAFKDRAATTVYLSVDGQKLATAVAKAGNERRRASFLPVEGET